MNEKNVLKIDISTKTITKFFGFLLFFIFLYLIREVVIMFVVSLILVAAIIPLLDYLNKYKIPKSLTVLMIYLLFFGLLTFLVANIVPQISIQIKELASDAPKFIQRFNEIFGQISEHENIASGIQSSLKNFSENLGGSAGNVFGAVSGFFGSIVTFIGILVLVFYMSIASTGIKAFIKSVFPKKYEKRTHDLIEKTQKKLGSWVIGQIILGFSIGILSFIGLKIIGIKFALTLAVIAGILEFIPVIGPVISAIPALFIAFTQSPTLGLIVLILYVGIQQLENHILVPMVMKKTTGLSPIVIILSLLIGFQLLGVLGAILAVPVALIVSIFVDEQVRKNMEEDE